MAKAATVEDDFEGASGETTIVSKVVVEVLLGRGIVRLRAPPRLAAAVLPAALASSWRAAKYERTIWREERAATDAALASCKLAEEKRPSFPDEKKEKNHRANNVTLNRSKKEDDILDVPAKEAPPTLCSEAALLVAITR